MNGLNFDELIKNVQDQFKGVDFEGLKKDSEKAMTDAFENSLEPLNAKLDKILKHLGIE